MLQLRGSADRVLISSFFSDMRPVQRIVFFNGESLSTSELILTTQGTAASDQLYGTGNPDSLLGGGGNDRIQGYGGNDYLDGGMGDDELFGGEGDDTYRNGGGHDFARDESLISNDTYFFQYGDGFLNIEDKGGVDSLVLGNLIAPADVSVRIDDGGNVDLVFRRDKSQQVSWSSVFDDVSGRLLAERAFEAIRFADGTVWTMSDIRTKGIEATSGDDEIRAFETDDTVDGGPGDDALGGKDGNDQLLAGGGNDRLEGGRGDDRLFGGEGADSLMGSDGNDTLAGGRGDDELRGSDGDDVYLYELGDGADRIIYPYEKDPGFDRIELGAGISADSIDVRIHAGNATLFLADGGSLHIEQMYPRYGDPSTIEEIRFHDGGRWGPDDLMRKVRAIIGNAGSQTLSGGDRGEQLSGLGGDDRLLGGAGNDLLEGGDGNDVLEGGPGNDLLDGGRGSNDVYLFGRGDGQDVIDGPIQEDLALSHLGVLRFKANVNPGDVRIKGLGENRGIELVVGGAGDSVVLEGFHYGAYAYARPFNTVQRVEFANGAAWDGPTIDRLMRGGNHAPTVNAVIEDRAFTEGDPVRFGIAGRCVCRCGRRCGRCAVVLR